MVALKHSEATLIDEAMQMNSGYVLNFTDRTFAEFFDDEFGINIYAEKYAFNGPSKAKRLRAFIRHEDAPLVGRVLRKLWDHRRTLQIYGSTESSLNQLGDHFIALIAQIESRTAGPKTDAIERFVEDATLEELVASIERDIAANRPASTLDRLHTYCMKKFAHLLLENGLTCSTSEPLHSRVGRYVRVIEQKHQLEDVSKQIIKNTIGVFEKFNHVRNNGSLAHDNRLVSSAEARFIFDTVTAILRFMKELEPRTFGQ